MAAPAAFSEAALHALWQRQRIPAEWLKTTAGEGIEVVTPGRYNRDAGPDFLQATLRLAGRLLQGDVELHLDARDWTNHGHHQDSAYNNVILHVALAEENAAAPIIMRENGLPVPQLLLPAAVFSAPAPPPATLLDCPLRRTTPEKILATVRHAGSLRFEARALAFAEQLRERSWDQAIYRGLAEALGYDKNQEPFRRLADLLPIDLIFAELRASRAHPPAVLVEALIFGAAGLLARPAAQEEAEDAAVTTYRETRREIWEQLRHSLQIRPLPAAGWRYFQLRPQNFPTRRLAGLCAMLLKFYRHGIVEHLAGLLEASGSRPAAKAKELVRFLVCPARGFWQQHYSFRDRDTTPAAHTGDLIGRDRSRDILVNLLLPALWLYYREAGNATRQNQVLEIYSQLPRLQENRLTLAMQQQLSAMPALRRALAASARTQQGLLHLQKLYCRPLRCAECLALADPLSG
ncbi:MAG: DUF2851 family protein [candidate division KSB1 bacterium]|nr:DUF2851 family protein [candidate division KSB1 bacterium]MDZ7274631.1 DUF2851 family protein [candidate division KSB1 bacterium]MDZ7285456.1 DUF2851 family protein [candidate division KSB1 bacterium]MDZ7298488.1 DUF2851 family protein [candidate division KSB1 bacterium]MDZ7349352.1 DUF2851 family protein [candidate division KSB1 bacterium]